MSSMRRPTGRDRRVAPLVSAAYAADDPRAYGTPLWWHDPAVAASITKDGSNRVSSMLDLSTNGVDVTNAGAVGTWPVLAAAALNGYAVLDFANQTLNRSLGAAILGTDWSIFAVVSNRSAITTNGNVLRQGNVGTNQGLDITFPASARTVLHKGVAGHVGGTMPNNTFEVWWIERAAGAAPTLKVNGSNDVLTNAGSTNYLTGADTFNYGLSANAARIAFCCAFGTTGINAAFAAALKTKYGL